MALDEDISYAHGTADIILTSQDIDDAKSVLFHNMYEFYSDTEIGHRLRMNAIDTFKNKNLINSDDHVLLAVEADLMNDTDVINALRIENMHEE